MYLFQQLLSNAQVLRGQYDQMQESAEIPWWPLLILILWLDWYPQTMMNLLPNNKTLSFPLHGVALQHSHKKNEGSSKKKHSLKIFMDFTDFIFPSFSSWPPFLLLSCTCPFWTQPQHRFDPIHVWCKAHSGGHQLSHQPRQTSVASQDHRGHPGWRLRPFIHVSLTDPPKKTPRNLGFKVPLVGSRKVPLIFLMDLKFKLSVFLGLKNSVVVNSLYFWAVETNMSQVWRKECHFRDVLVPRRVKYIKLFPPPS